MKLFMRKPAVRQIKKEKYYKNIKKLLLFHHVSNIILIKLDDNTTQSFQNTTNCIEKVRKIRYYVEYVGT